jgi:hypothetical protein
MVTNTAYIIAYMLLSSKSVRKNIRIGQITMDALVRQNQVDQRNSDQQENISGIQNIFVLNILKFRSNFDASSYLLYIIHTVMMCGKIPNSYK